MKLLIDIPEHIYEHAKELSEDSRDEGEAMRAIANGSRQESCSEIPNTCGDAISRQAVLKIIDGWYDNNRDTENIEDLIVLITYMSSVTPQQRTGRWIKQNYGWNWQCSECGFVTPPSAKEIFTFCLNCGAKMEDVKDES